MQTLKQVSNLSSLLLILFFSLAVNQRWSKDRDTDLGSDSSLRHSGCAAVVSEAEDFWQNYFASCFFVLNIKIRLKIKIVNNLIV